MGRGVWRHGVQSQHRSSGALPAIPNQSRLCTHLPHEYTGTQKETRAFVPGQASADHLPSCDLVPEALHPLVSCVNTRLSKQAPCSTSPGPTGLPNLGFILNQSSDFASGSQQALEAVQLYSLEVTPSYKSLPWCLLVCLFIYGTVTLLST